MDGRDGRTRTVERKESLIDAGSLRIRGHLFVSATGPPPLQCPSSYVVPPVN